MNESQSLNINPKIESQVSEYVKEMYMNEYLSVESVDQLPSESVEMTISLRHSQLINFRPRRLSYADKEKIRDILDKLLSERIIRPSESPYASPIVLVRKKNDELRLCIDYREINKITVRDNYPTPLIDDHLDRLHDKKYFSCLDLKSGFHHVRVSEESIKFTSRHSSGTI